MGTVEWSRWTPEFVYTAVFRDRGEEYFDRYVLILNETSVWFSHDPEMGMKMFEQFTKDVASNTEEYLFNDKWSSHDDAFIRKGK